MSKRDYIAIAGILRETPMESETRAELVRRLCTVLADDNARFNAGKFRQACEPAGYVVVENTPGYLPESDDPPLFETFAEAEEYAAALADGYRDTWGLTRDTDAISVSRESRTLWRIENRERARPRPRRRDHQGAVVMSANDHLSGLEVGNRYSITWAGVVTVGTSGDYLGADEQGWWVFEYPSNTAEIDAHPIRLHVNPAHVANWRQLAA